MDYLDFLATALVDNRILEIERGSTLSQVGAALGDSFVDDMDRRRRYLRRDYGLIDLNFVRDAGWVVSNAIVQVHRLVRSALVPARLVKIYDPFPSRIAFSELHGRIEDRGKRLSLASMASDRPYERYISTPGSSAFALVVGDAEGGAIDGLAKGKFGVFLRGELVSGAPANHSA